MVALGTDLRVHRPLTHVSRRKYPIAVDDVSCKLVFCAATQARQDYKLDVWRFTTYSNTYVKRDPNLA